MSAFLPPVKLGHMCVDSRQPSGRANVTLDTIKGNSVQVCAQALACVFFWVTSASFTEVKWGQI